MSIDFDRSGVSLQSFRVDLGPSLGWVDVAGGILTITQAMSLTLPLGINAVNVNVAGAVVLTLPRAKGVIAIPSSLALVPIRITDAGGHADAFPIAINAAPGEAISGLASVALAVKFGTIAFRANPGAASWSVLS